MTNSSLDPNKHLKVFYSELLLINGAAIFVGESVKLVPLGASVPAIVGVTKWWDSGLASHNPVALPKHTKKAHIRVIVPPGVIAPKHPVFLVNDYNKTDYDLDENEDGSITLNFSTDRKGIALFDGSEIEVFGYDEIRKLAFLSNLEHVIPGPTTLKFNATPVNVYLNITLYK